MAEGRQRAGALVYHEGQLLGRDAGCPVGTASRALRLLHVKGFCGFPAAPPAWPAGRGSPRCEVPVPVPVPAGRAGHQLWIPGSCPAAGGRAGGWKAGRQGGSVALRRCGREVAGMASVVLSEAEKLYIVHGVQVPGQAPGGRERVRLGRRGRGRKEGGRERALHRCVWGRASGVVII